MAVAGALVPGREITELFRQHYFVGVPGIFTRTPANGIFGCVEPLNAPGYQVLGAGGDAGLPVVKDIAGQRG